MPAPQQRWTVREAIFGFVCLLVAGYAITYLLRSLSH